MKNKILRKLWACQNCGHSWFPDYKNPTPKVCAICHSIKVAKATNEEIDRLKDK